MGNLTKDTFICLDCESTGLDVKNDRIIEIAAIRFTFTKQLGEHETLINPNVAIPEESTKIHHITQDMVAGKPSIETVLPDFLKFIGNDIIVGHGIQFDIDILIEAAKRHSIPCHLHENTSIDTLRLARLYGQSPVNSLEKLRQHFNIAAEGAHRAMNDVRVNIEVFKHLATKFKTTEALLERLKKPIPMRTMPLGKYRGREFKDVPIEYLRWAVHQNFDLDLLFSLKQELRKRGKGNTFSQAASPFADL